MKYIYKDMSKKKRTISNIYAYLLIKFVVAFVSLLSKTAEASLTLQVTGTEIAVQYRKYVAGKSPKAKVLVDGNEVAVIDATFDETWGDKLELTPVAGQLAAGSHEVQIVTGSEEGLDNPMSIVSIITAG